MEEANLKIIELEENLYETKTIQLELLENLKMAEDNYEELIIAHEKQISDL